MGPLQRTSRSCGSYFYDRALTDLNDNLHIHEYQRVCFRARVSKSAGEEGMQRLRTFKMRNSLNQMMAIYILIKSRELLTSGWLPTCNILQHTRTQLTQDLLAILATIQSYVCVNSSKLVQLSHIKIGYNTSINTKPNFKLVSQIFLARFTHQQ